MPFGYPLKLKYLGDYVAGDKILWVNEIWGRVTLKRGTLA
jgi:hypothetical protein